MSDKIIYCYECGVKVAIIVADPKAERKSLIKKGSVMVCGKCKKGGKDSMDLMNKLFSGFGGKI